MLLGFKQRFAEPIERGTKVFTMRVKPKRMPKVGERLYLYTGLRTKNCRKLSDTERLRSIQKVNIRIIKVPNQVTLEVWVDGHKLSDATLPHFVRYDGFKDIPDFIQWWIESSTGKKNPKTARIGGKLLLFHWTDLRFGPLEQAIF